MRRSPAASPHALAAVILSLAGATACRPGIGFRMGPWADDQNQPPVTGTVQITPNGGSFIGSVSVDLFSYTPEAAILYTLDGSDPLESGTPTEYGGSFILSESASLAARAQSPGYLPSATANAVFVVTAPTGNQPPNAINQFVTTLEDQSVGIALSYSDPDDGPGPHAFTITEQPAHGTLIGSGATWSYQPAAGYVGADSFSWRVNDGADDSNIGVVSITITDQLSDALVIDHRHVSAFGSIPAQYIQSAAAMRFLFRHASVGANIRNGLDCLGELYSPGPRPVFCDNGIPVGSPAVHGSQYDSRGWTFECHTLNWGNCNPGWNNKVFRFADRINGTLAPTTDYPVLENVQSFSVWGFKLGNVDDLPQIGAFWDLDHNPSITTLTALEAAHPTKRLMYWTMGIARMSFIYSHQFNASMRSFAIANDKVLFDFADIVSHHEDGSPCTDTDQGQTVAEMCDEYTNETNGGHLNGLGTHRVAKALWVMMARLSGWDGQ